MFNFKDKVALITGSSRGIGKATAIMFAETGADVIINYQKDEASANQVKNECLKFGVRAIAVKADMADQQSVNEMVAISIKEFGKIDILINNAGIWNENHIDGMDTKLLQKTLDININGCFYTAMAVVPHMKKRNSGVIVNISSTAGQRGESFHSPYAATKGALIAMTKSWGPELIQHNIRVNCVAPGWVDTDMSREALDGPEGDSIRSVIPVGRAGTPEELAGPILFMASDMATFIVGEILNVNGGAVLCG